MRNFPISQHLYASLQAPLTFSFLCNFSKSQENLKRVFWCSSKFPLKIQSWQSCLISVSILVLVLGSTNHIKAGMQWVLHQDKPRKKTHEL